MSFISNFKAGISRVPGLIITAILLAISTVFLSVGEAEGGITIVWIILGSSGLALYAHAFIVLLPRAFPKKKPLISYVRQTCGVILLLEIPVILWGYIFTDAGDVMMAVGILNAMSQLLVTMPISWLVYKRFITGKAEISLLKKELGRSVASIDLLRSQINPHFLFNALNTLYGTSIQEKADRTSEGIQRLGDMMRFMLQENTRESIPLSSEVEYLVNYISLQKLRTDTSDNIQIEADLPKELPVASIPPMLLIPFVENSFKHGVSFLSPSYIKITLKIRNNTLYFEVANSIRSEVRNDIERYKGGIGLDNVRQRLQLFYPGTHELVVKEGSVDYFVRLTLPLEVK